MINVGNFLSTDIIGQVKKFDKYLKVLAPVGSNFGTDLNGNYKTKPSDIKKSSTVR